ncbi:MAG TPA: FHA domain-containing protein [Thermoanaerobaculia bacterium]|nr:FHA domain-containing protein [Thermoanaerobaculia bacterium]
MRLTFGDCTYDSGTREVLRAGQALALTPKAFVLLEVLIERRPGAVSKKELHDRIWPGTFVTDTSLANLVAGLRAALGDDATEPRVVRTVHRFGYAFCAEVEPARDRGAARAAVGVICRLLWGDRVLSLDQGDNVLGRDQEAGIWIDDVSVSRCHARITIEGNGATIEDLGSKNGTKLNKAKIDAVERLKDRDAIEVGAVKLIVRILRRTGTTATADDAAR